MNISNYTRSWVDDYLDLYNFAKSIGDTAWQKDILEKLQDRNSIIREDLRQVNQQDLWKMFDCVNAKMMELFHQLREATSRNQANVLLEKVWELKLKRVEITRKIRTL